jgi:1-acyl-sn-glycerol-3-phosphate acyltransferase
VRYVIAPNVAVATFSDAVRLALPVRRLLSRRRMRQVAAARTDRERDLETRRWSAELLQALDVRVQPTGLHHIEPDQIYLVLSLHEALLDVPLISRLPLPVTFVARADLAKQRPIERLVQAGRPILINPESPSALRVVLREVERVRTQGRSTVMFPQGSVLGIETMFQRGALVVSRRLGLPVLPVVITGSHRIWEHPFSSRLRRSQTVHMEVLAPRRVETAPEYRELEREMKRRATQNPTVPPRRFVPERDGYWDGYRFDIDPDFATLDERVRRHRRTVSTNGTARATRTA